jgi:glutamate decarboxylase
MSRCGCGLATVRHLPLNLWCPAIVPKHANPMPLHRAIDHKESTRHLHHIDASALAFETGFSSFALEEFPKYRMRTEPMPAAVAEGIITQELELDGNPALNLASFVTTRFDETTHKLCDRMLPVNWIDFDEYPQTVEIHNRCVNIIAHLFHAPVADGEQAVGTSTVGSSEAIMLAVLAMKWRWRAARKAAGKDYSRPNMVMGAEVQVCWEKATAYFDVEARYVSLHDDVYVMDPAEAIAQCDENTIGICGILGTTYTGQFEASLSTI